MCVCVCVCVCLKIIFGPEVVRLRVSPSARLPFLLLIVSGAGEGGTCLDGGETPTACGNGEGLPLVPPCRTRS